MIILREKKHICPYFNVIYVIWVWTYMWTYMCTNACMYAHMIECVNRVGVPSSVRDSQQPFLVLDGAVRMHWLVLSFGREGMYSSIRKWKDETWKVSSSIRRDISFTKKGRVDLQTYRIWQGEALWAIPSAGHASAVQYWTQGQNLVYKNVTFYFGEKLCSD